MMSEMLVAVTEGTDRRRSRDPWLPRAGRRRTAQKIDPARASATDTRYVASFVGFVPAERPRLAIAVVLDEPMGGTYAGGSVRGARLPSRR